jgi:hypothetical protein
MATPTVPLRQGRRDLDVRLVDARVRHDEPEPMLDDQHVRRSAHDAARLAEDHFDEARVLVHLSRELERAGGRNDGGEIDVASFRLRDDLLREYDDVAVRELAARAPGDQRDEIVARPDPGQARHGPELQPGGRRHAGRHHRFARPALRGGASCRQSRRLRLSSPYIAASGISGFAIHW